MLTRKEILSEYAKCLTDPIYAIETYLETFDKTREGFVPFKLFDRQKEIVGCYEKHRHNLVTKPRQAGISTTTQAYCAIKIGFADPNNPETIVVIANKLTLAKKFLKGIKDYIQQVPRWVWGADYYGTEDKEKKSIFVKDSQIEVELPNGSKIIAVATSEDALRGYTPTFLIFDEAAFIDRGADLYAAAVTSLGCLTKDSLILTNNGLFELGELVSEKEKLGFTNLEIPHIVCDKNGSLTPATQTFVSGYGKTYKIKTKLGLEIEGSWKHPLLINDNGEEKWVRMQDLSVGDNVMLNYNQNFFGVNSYIPFKFSEHKNSKKINIPSKLIDNLDFCYLLGLFVAEGNFYNGGICITNVDDYISDFLTKDKAKLGRSFKKYDEKHHFLTSMDLVRWFDMFGLKKHNAKEKEIPLDILKMPKKVIVNFLQGMFDGDGMSTIKDIKYSSTSKKMVQTLQVLLLNFGIISHIKKETQKTSESSVIPNKDHICVIYNLKIYSNYALKFYDEIGFRLERKQQNKKFLEDKLLNSRYVNVTQETILKVLKESNILKKEVRFLERFWKSKFERLSYESLNRLSEKVGEDKILGDLKEQVIWNEYFYKDEIISIRTSEDYTYDLHVPESNSFISNGIISHNTGGKCILISCVTDDTFVLTPNGIKEVSQFIDYEKKGGYLIDQYEIFGYGGSRKSHIFHNNGYVDTKIIETKYTKLEGSNNHKLYAYSNDKNSFDWVELQNLNVGDYVPIVYGQDVWGNNDDCSDFIVTHNAKMKNLVNPKVVNKDMAYFMGLFLAEGSTYKKIDGGNHVGTSITITCGDDVGYVFDKLGVNYSCSDNLHYTTGSKQLGEFLEYIGFDLSLKANQKVIPKRIFEMSRENVIEFIKGFMDGDGYSRIDNGRVGLCSASKRLVEQFRILFLNLGILCEYQEILMKPTKLVKVESLNYRLNINNYNSVRYYDIIGFGFKRKEVKKLSLNSYRDNSPYDVIPNGGDIIRGLYKTKGKGLKYYRDLGCDISHITKKSSKIKHVSRGLLLRFLTIVNESNDLIKENITWVQIKSIKLSKNNTYDFSLPDNPEDFWCHSVIYNGILGHQTPNGYDPLYYKTYEQSIRGENTYNVIELKWYEDPRYNKGLKWIKDEKLTDEYEFTIDSFKKKISEGYKPTSPWYENMCKNMNNDKKKIAQELDVSFLGSGGNVIDDEWINFHEKTNVIQPLFIDKSYYDGNSGLIYIWSEPIEDHEYVLSADVARGDGSDYSSFQVIDFTTMEQVAEYQGKVPPDNFAEILKIYGLKYNALVVVDNIGVGNTTVSKLVELKYPNLYYDEKGKDNQVAGFNINGVRLNLISNLEIAIRTNTIKIRSMRLVGEMKTYIYKNGRPDHMEGYHDDLLMALGIGLWILEYSFKKLKKAKSQAKAILSGWVCGSNLPQTNTIINSSVNPEKNIINPSHQGYMGSNNNNNIGQYNWLFGKMK